MIVGIIYDDFISVPYLVVAMIRDRQSHLGLLCAAIHCGVHYIVLGSLVSIFDFHFPVEDFCGSAGH